MGKHCVRGRVGRDRSGRCALEQAIDEVAGTFGSTKPTASIPNACKGWSETQAAYRFFAQEDIGWEDILEPHFNCTYQRMTKHAVVLCIQDTTELDFNGQEISGLGTVELCGAAWFVFASDVCRNA